MTRHSLILLALLVGQSTFAEQPKSGVSPDEPTSELVSFTEEPGNAGTVPGGGGPEEMNADQGGMGMGGRKPRVDMQGPAFVAGDHVVQAGHWMTGYRYSNAYLDGNRTGATSLTDQQALDFHGPGPTGFMMVPTHGTVETHLFSVMRGVTENVTVYVVPALLADSMTMLRRDGATVTSSNTGFGDLPFGALWRARKTENDEVILNFGLSAPTGDIEGTYLMPNGMSIRYPYPMRLGRGTWDLRPGITYRYYFDRASIGFQGMCDLPMGFNELGYRVGDEYRTNVWFDYLLDADKTLAATFRIEGLWRYNCVGSDAGLNPSAMPGNDPNMRGGDYMNFGYGLSYMLPAHLGRMDFEVVTPIVQNVRGVQLGTDWAFAARYQKKF